MVAGEPVILEVDVLAMTEDKKRPPIIPDFFRALAVTIGSAYDVDMDVTLYSTKTCQYCWETRQYLKGLQIPFREIRIDDDVEAAREVQRLVGDQVVPVVVVRQEQVEPVTVVGFDRQRLQVALGGML